MQYAVPQFTDVEDKLIGPLTLKQFLSLLATGGLVLFFWTILGLSIFFFFFALPVALIGLGLTFGKYNGRPMFLYVGAFFNFFSRPQARIFKREEPMAVIKMQPKQETTLKQTTEVEPAQSRLKKLAYILDQKSEEERQLVENKWQN